MKEVADAPATFDDAGGAADHRLNFKIRKFLRGARKPASMEDPDVAYRTYPSELPLPFSKAVEAGGFVFLSGQIPLDADGKPLHGPIGAQTRNVLDRIAATLEEAGLGLADVLRVTVWLSDLALFAEFNEVYREYFKAPDLPARSTVAARLAFDVDVEIEVTAYRR